MSQKDVKRSSSLDKIYRKMTQSPSRRVSERLPSIKEEVKTKEHNLTSSPMQKRYKS